MSQVLTPPTGISSRDEQPAYFEVGAETLFGILTRPRTPRGKAGLIMVPGAERLGYRNRVGVMLSHRLAQRGHPVLRFNYRGCGDSTGRAGRFRLDDLFTSDAVGATEWLRGQGVERFLYSGSCFGARTALAVAAHEPDVAGVVVAAMPMTDYASGERGAQRAGQAHVSSLARKALSRNGLRGLRDRDMRRIYLEAYRHKMRRLVRRQPSQGGDGIRPILVRDLTTLIARGVPLLFLYGERDSAYAEFLEARQGAIGRLLEEAGEAVEVRVIPGILHGWASIPAGETAVELMVEWATRVDRQSRAG
ncbi:MAG: alpha/beta fold hydrolase [Actinomycetota bacterium]